MVKIKCQLKITIVLHLLNLLKNTFILMLVYLYYNLSGVMNVLILQ